LEEHAEPYLVGSLRRRRYSNQRDASIVTHAPEMLDDVSIRLRCAMMRLIDDNEVERRAIPRLQAVASHRSDTSDDNVTTFLIGERPRARCAMLRPFNLDANTWHQRSQGHIKNKSKRSIAR
jgi:hypothetical protein